MKPFIHAENSAKKYGGKLEDYLPIHDFMDSSKAHLADPRHRAILHSTFGCFIVEKAFGSVATNSDGKLYSPRDIAEQHCLEDLGHIPNLNDWFAKLPIETWMGGGNKEEIPSRNAILSYADLKAKANKFFEDSKDKLKEDLNKIFEASPHNKIVGVGYTPYFNDGDTCEYSFCGWVNADKTVSTEDEDYEDDDYLDLWEDDAELPEGMRDEDLILRLFGDHQKITWTRGKGFETEDYDHD